MIFIRDKQKRQINPFFFGTIIVMKPIFLKYDSEKLNFFVTKIYLFWFLSEINKMLDKPSIFWKYNCNKTHFLEIWFRETKVFSTKIYLLCHFGCEGQFEEKNVNKSNFLKSIIVFNSKFFGNYDFIFWLMVDKIKTIEAILIKDTFIIETFVCTGQHMVDLKYLFFQLKLEIYYRLSGTTCYFLYPLHHIYNDPVSFLRNCWHCQKILSLLWVHIERQHYFCP